MDGSKDIIGVWIGEHESSKFWLSVLNNLKSRGVLEVYLFCVNGLKGLQEAIVAAYPKAQIQRCIISSDPIQYPLCQLQRHQSVNGGP